jgi:serine O-acetyltransferase
MNIRQLFKHVKSDYYANGADWTKPGFRTLAVYRFGVWRMSVRPFLLRAPLSLIYRFFYRRCRNVYGIELPYSAKVGQRVVIEHQGGIVIHGKTQIGDECVIRQNCTFGIRSKARLDDAPVLDVGVDVGAGAAILGRVHIGEGAQIGANAVVLNDVPAFSLAVGIPAQIKPLKMLPD